MKKGYSIVEILIVIAIMGILAGGILTAYRFIAKENAQRHLVAKQESDVNVLINQLLKDIESAGFGVDVDNLTLTSLSTETLQFPSLATREEALSGCWAVVDNSSKMITQFNDKNVLNYMGNNCQLNSNYWYVILNPLTKKKIEDSNLCQQGLCNCGYGGNTCESVFANTIIFFADDNHNYQYPQSFITTYSLTQTNLPKECASGTYNLVKTLGTSGYSGYQANQPVISCVFPSGFKVRAGIQSGGTIVYQDTVSSSDIQNWNLKLFRICLIMQIGARQNTATTQPQFSTDCGGGPTINSTWWNNTGRWYRWKVIEQDIPLRNYQ